MKNRNPPPGRARTFPALVALLLMGVPAAAVAAPPLGVGSHGFDWLHPRTAACVPITDELSARFQRCEHRDQGGFDGVTASDACRVSAKVEYMVFKDRATCEEQLDIMEANAP